MCLRRHVRLDRPATRYLVAGGWRRLNWLKLGDCQVFVEPHYHLPGGIHWLCGVGWVWKGDVGSGRLLNWRTNDQHAGCLVFSASRDSVGTPQLWVGKVRLNRRHRSLQRKGKLDMRPCCSNYERCDCYEMVSQRVLNNRFNITNPFPHHDTTGDRSPPDSHMGIHSPCHSSRPTSDLQTFPLQRLVV
jgi:hypothetical protein